MQGSSKRPFDHERDHRKERHPHVSDDHLLLRRVGFSHDCLLREKTIHATSGDLTCRGDTADEASRRAATSSPLRRLEQPRLGQSPDPAMTRMPGCAGSNEVVRATITVAFRPLNEDRSAAYGRLPGVDSDASRRSPIDYAIRS